MADANTLRARLFGGSVGLGIVAGAAGITAMVATAPLIVAAAPVIAAVAGVAGLAAATGIISSATMSDKTLTSIADRAGSIFRKLTGTGLDTSVAAPDQKPDKDKGSTISGDFYRRYYTNDRQNEVGVVPLGNPVAMPTVVGEDLRQGPRIGVTGPLQSNVATGLQTNAMPVSLTR